MNSHSSAPQNTEDIMVSLYSLRRAVLANDFLPTQNYEIRTAKTFLQNFRSAKFLRHVFAAFRHLSIGKAFQYSFWAWWGNSEL
jgi:hypothetical protein